MTYVYSARRKAMAEQIESALRDLDRSAAARGQPPHLGGADNRAAAYWLAGLFEQLLRSNLPAIRNAMKWLQTTSNLMSSANLAMQWTSPVGLPIVHEYRKLPLRTVEVYCGRTIKLQVQDEESEGDQSFPIDRGKAANGIAANFIHSLDAAHLMMVASACADQGIPALAVVHDSFGTHAANTGKLATILRETFVDLYKRDLLGELRDAVLEQLNGQPELAAQVPPSLRKVTSSWRRSSIRPTCLLEQNSVDYPLSYRGAELPVDRLRTALNDDLISTVFLR
jgi:DNA-directed RNA polymerase